MKRFTVSDNYPHDNTEFRIIDDIARKVAAPQTMIMVDMPPPGEFIPPTFVIEHDEAQNMFQQMWDQGYRPKGGKVEDATIAALKGHISFAESVTNKLLPGPQS